MPYSVLHFPLFKEERNLSEVGVLRRSKKNLERSGGDFFSNGNKYSGS